MNYAVRRFKNYLPKLIPLELNLLNYEIDGNHNNVQVG